MTSTERVVLRAAIRRVNYYREQKFDKYVILDYVDSAIRKVRGHCSDELLRSKMVFYKRMINELDVLNYVTGPNKYYS